MRNYFTLLFSSFLLIQTQHAQTTLSVGDASILWYSNNIDGLAGDEFGFVTFVDLAVNTRIYFTDHGASNAGVFSFVGSDGVVEYLVSAAIPAGSVIAYNDNTNGTWTSTSGTLDLQGAGDQLFIFQDGDGVGGNDPEDNPVFIMCLQAASQDKADICDEINDHNHTNSPSVLTPVTFGDGTGTFLALGTSAVDCQGENDHLYFNGGSSFASVAAAKAAVQDPDNWNGSAVTVAPADYTLAVAAFLLAGSLPVEWISFRAEIEATDVLLNWQTATEINNEKFIIEHSKDGRFFNAIGALAGKGNSEVLTNYHFRHPNPSPGLHYYRLKQVNFDGMYEYSTIISVEMGHTDKFFGTVWPNPSTDGFVNIELNSADYQKQCTIQLFSSTAQLLWQSDFALETGHNLLTVDWSTFENGLYITKMLLGDKVLSYKVYLGK